MSGRKCMLTGKKANNGRTVSFSHIRNKTLQQVNLQVRVIDGYTAERGGWATLDPQRRRGFASRRTRCFVRDSARVKAYTRDHE
mmetsp:Transcript_5856/g.19728  ORF Transcript_5856/g.19728 Transcript_5856/m.19728 type:complete len:84 (+) Transcript_5856:438-689(+)